MYQRCIQYAILFILSMLQTNYVFCQSPKYWRHPDADITTEQKIRRDGYPLEVHNIETEDNYILKTFRLQYGQKKPKNLANRSIVILCHGFSATPDLFFVLGAQRALPYYLADMGFDVWVYSARGILPAKHKMYNANTDAAYWNFSYHHIGIYDIPAVIDYSLNVTDQKKVFVIGHSGGNTAYFVMTTIRPQYNKKIKIAASYAPSTYLDHTQNPLVTLFSYIYPVFKRVFVDILSLPVLFPYVEEVLPYLKEFCSHTSVLKACIQVGHLIAGNVSLLINENITTLITNTFPAKLGTIHILHYMQQLYNGGFHQFDYGRKRNLKVYNQTTPPEYNLKKSTALSALFYSDHDMITTSKDVEVLMTKLPNVVLDYKVKAERFTHIDFLFAVNATELVYEPTRRLFQDYDDGKVFDKSYTFT